MAKNFIVPNWVILKASGITMTVKAIVDYFNGTSGRKAAC